LLRESRLGSRYLKCVEDGPVSFFHRLGVTPDHLTYLALLISFLTIPAFSHSLWLGGLGVLISGAIDTMDGGLARRADQKTRSGAFLDSVLDRYSDFFAVFGIWLFFLKHLPQRPALVTSLLFFFLIGSFMVSYSRARGEGLGLSISMGFFGRAERVVCLGLGSILNDLLTLVFPSQTWLADHLFFIALLFLLTLGTHLTALQRILYLSKNL
jgi:CDP-diacylglycerol--glycerol-3-phosphate 3-phosphatidyltransferase